MKNIMLWDIFNSYLKGYDHIVWHTNPVFA